MRKLRVSNTSLSRIAATELGDSMQWTRLAQINKLYSPLIYEPTDLLVPERDQNAPKGLPK